MDLVDTTASLIMESFLQSILGSLTVTIVEATESNQLKKSELMVEFNGSFRKLHNKLVSQLIITGGEQLHNLSKAEYI